MNSLVLQSQEPLPQSGFSYPSPKSDNPHSQQYTNDFLLLDNWINTIYPAEHSRTTCCSAPPWLSQAPVPGSQLCLKQGMQTKRQLSLR